MLKRLYRYFLQRHVHTQEQYVDPLIVFSGSTMEEDWAAAILINRTMDLYTKMKQEGKTLTSGYTPPDPSSRDRIGAQADKEGVVLPKDRRRQEDLQRNVVKQVVSELRTGRIHSIL